MSVVSIRLIYHTIIGSINVVVYFQPSIGNKSTKLYKRFTRITYMRVLRRSIYLYLITPSINHMCFVCVCFSGFEFFSESNLLNLLLDFSFKGAQSARRQSLAKLHNLPLEAPITKVISLICTAQENSNDQVVQILDKVRTHRHQCCCCCCCIDTST